MVKPQFAFGTSKEAHLIREEVFANEQGYKNEFEKDETQYLTLVLFFDGYPISTGRLLELDPETYAISRVAVRKPFRNQKVGTYTMKFLINKAISLGARKVTLGAQLDKKGFYESLGFKESGEGEIYFDEGNPHIKMEKSIVNNRYPYKKKRTS